MELLKTKKIRPKFDELANNKGIYENLKASICSNLDEMEHSVGDNSLSKTMTINTTLVRPLGLNKRQLIIDGSLPT